MPRTPQKPMDAYFRAVLSFPVVARQMIEFAAPVSLLQTINLNHLAPVSESFVDGRLRKSIADMVFKTTAQNGADVRICFLFEHKSRPPGRSLYPQLLRYVVNILESDIRQKRAHFTLTIPIVFYNGSKPFDVKPLETLFGDIHGQLRKFLPRFNFLCIDLQKISRSTLANLEDQLTARNVFLTMKQDFDDAFFKENCDKIFIFADDALSEEQALMLYELTFNYILNVSTLQQEEIMEITAKLPRTYRKRKLTVREQIEEEGMKKGREEGMQKGMEKGMEKEREILVQKFAQKFPNFSIQQIAEAFDLPTVWVESVLGKQ